VIKKLLVFAVLGFGLALGMGDITGNSVELIASAQAQEEPPGQVPAPGILALFGIGGLALAYRLKRR
jgi:hypothetical protein